MTLLQDPERANRLGPADTAWLLMDRALRVPMVNQMVWIFPGPGLPDGLVEFSRRLSQGPFSRLAVPARVPGARARWIPAPPADPPVISARSLSADEVHDWLDAQADERLDAVVGPPWRLAAAPLADGGSVVSLCMHHAVCDGSAVLQNIRAAALGSSLGRIPDETAPAAHRWGSDLRDAAGEFSGAARSLVAELRAGRPPAPAAVGEHLPPAPVAAGKVRVPTVFAEIPDAAWEAAATTRGGSTNALLIAIAAGLTAAGGRPLVDQTVPVGVPVATRADGDLAGNSNSPALVPVRIEDGRYDDLSPIRAASRTAFAALDPARLGRQAQITAPLAGLIPYPVARWATRFMPAALCTTSNLGPAPDYLLEVGGLLSGEPADAMLIRTVAQDLSPELAQRSGSGVTAWAIGTPTAVTLTLQTLDLVRYPDRSAWESQVTTELDRWNLPHRVW